MYFIANCTLYVTSVICIEICHKTCKIRTRLELWRSKPLTDFPEGSHGISITSGYQVWLVSGTFWVPISARRSPLLIPR